MHGVPAVLLTLLPSPGQAEVVEIVDRAAVAAMQAAVGASGDPPPAVMAIFEPRTNLKGRLSLIGRRRQYVRLRRAGRLTGWVAVVMVLLALVVAAAAGLR